MFSIKANFQKLIAKKTIAVLISSIGEMNILASIPRKTKRQEPRRCCVAIPAPPSTTLRPGAKSRRFSHEEEGRLIAAAQAGDDKATRKLIMHHLPWVQVQARAKWRSLNPPGNSNDLRGIELNDLVAAGLEALVRALRGWRPGANNGFNAYARHWILGCR
jgi:DNA-directed RNA polymerase sigma subunit (sigma70/sigma32)